MALLLGNAHPTRNLVKARFFAKTQLPICSTSRVLFLLNPSRDLFDSFAMSLACFSKLFSAFATGFC